MNTINPTIQADLARQLYGKSITTGQGATSYGGTALNVGQSVSDVIGILGSKGEVQDKIQAVKERIGLAVADYYTFGGASMAYNYLNKKWPGLMNKLRKIESKFDFLAKDLGKLFGSKNRWQTEGKRVNQLIKDGVEIPESLLGATALTRGRSKEELIDHSLPLDHIGYAPDGGWVNNAFAHTRNEGLLQPEDIWGYSAFFEKFGNDWLQGMTESERRQISQAALALGCVHEHRGTIDIKWTPELEAAVAQIRS